MEENVRFTGEAIPSGVLAPRRNLRERPQAAFDGPGGLCYTFCLPA